MGLTWCSEGYAGRPGQGEYEEKLERRDIEAKYVARHKRMIYYQNRSKRIDRGLDHSYRRTRSGSIANTSSPTHYLLTGDDNGDITNRKARQKQVADNMKALQKKIRKMETKYKYVTWPAVQARVKALTPPPSSSSSDTPTPQPRPSPKPKPATKKPKDFGIYDAKIWEFVFDATKRPDEQVKSIGYNFIEEYETEVMDSVEVTAGQMDKYFVTRFGPQLVGYCYKNGKHTFLCVDDPKLEIQGELRYAGATYQAREIWYWHVERALKLERGTGYVKAIVSKIITVNMPIELFKKLDGLDIDAQARVWREHLAEVPAVPKEIQLRENLRDLERQRQRKERARQLRRTKSNQHAARARSSTVAGEIQSYERPPPRSRAKSVPTFLDHDEKTEPSPLEEADKFQPGLWGPMYPDVPAAIAETDDNSQEEEKASRGDRSPSGSAYKAYQAVDPMAHKGRPATPEELKQEPPSSVADSPSCRRLAEASTAYELNPMIAALTMVGFIILGMWRCRKSNPERESLPMPGRL